MSDAPYASRPPTAPSAKQMTVDNFRSARRAVAVGGLCFVLAILAGWLLWLPLALLAPPAWVASFIGIVRSYGFRCPQCGRWFARAWDRANPFTNKCVHCGHSIRE